MMMAIKMITNVNELHFRDVGSSRAIGKPDAFVSICGPSASAYVAEAVL